MGETKLSNNLNAVDIMKFIAAILVVCIHTNPLFSINTTLNFAFINIVTRIAVPFFFVASGYLFYSKSGENSKNYFIKYIKHICSIYITWSMVYSLFDIYDLYNKYHTINNIVIIYIRNFIFSGSHYHLWYFTALILAIAILYLWTRKYSIKSLLIVSFILYIVGLFGDSYSGFVSRSSSLSYLYKLFVNLFGPTRCGLFFGLLYVALGAYIRDSRFIISVKKSGIFAVLSLFALGIEVSILKKFSGPQNYNMMLMLLPLSFFLFQFLINVKIDWHLNYKWLRSSSTLIYCSHALFLLIYPEILSVIRYKKLFENSMFKFLTVYISSLLLSAVIIRLQNYRSSQYKGLSS